MEIIYIGPTCPRCSGVRYTKMVFDTSEYKKCIECGRLSAIVSTDNLVEE